MGDTRVKIESSSDRLVHAVRQLEMPTGARVVVAVSGGPDSIALLDTLRQVAQPRENAWQLRVAHVQHGLRGAESEADEEFVRRVAGGWRLPVDVLRVP